MVPSQTMRRVGVDQAGETVFLSTKSSPNRSLAIATVSRGALRLGDRAHEGLIREPDMAVDHVEMALVDRQVDRLAHRAAGMMDEGRHVGELHEIAEILDGGVAAALVEVADEGRAVDRREDRVVAADDDVALGVARMLDVSRGRGLRRSACAAGRAGKRTRVPFTSQPAPLQSWSASGSSRNSMPISSRIVSALCSMSGRPSSLSISVNGMARVI